MKGRCGPAKSSPETLSSSVNSVMNFGKAEVGGAFRSCQAVFLAIVTAMDLSLGIEYLCCTLFMVAATPPCKVCTWQCLKM